MQHFRMKLYGIQFFLFAFGSSHRAVGGEGYCLKTRRRLRNIIEMTHPADGMGGDARK